MYLAGDDSTNGGYDRQWHIEKRLLSDGSLTGFGVLTVDPGTGFDIALGVFLDGPALYVSGMHHVNPPLPNQDLQIMIMKIDATTAGTITTFGGTGAVTENPTPLVDGLAVLGADATHTYLAGVENVDLINSPPTSDVGWRIEKRVK